MEYASNNLPSRALYQKAQDIFVLSRSIAHYLSQDLAALQLDGREHSLIYFTGDIVQQSNSLGPNIQKAEIQLYSEEKHKYAASVQRLSNLLYKNCLRLEQANSNGIDFLKLLRVELKKFKKLQRVWLLTL